MESGTHYRSVATTVYHDYVPTNNPASSTSSSAAGQLSFPAMKVALSKTTDAKPSNCWPFMEDLYANARLPTPKQIKLHTLSNPNRHTMAVTIDSRQSNHEGRVLSLLFGREVTYIRCIRIRRTFKWDQTDLETGSADDRAS